MPLVRLVDDDAAAFHYPSNLLEYNIDIGQGIAFYGDDVREVTASAAREHCAVLGPIGHRSPSEVIMQTVAPRSFNIFNQFEFLHTTAMPFSVGTGTNGRRGTKMDPNGFPSAQRIHPTSLYSGALQRLESGF